MIARIRKGNDFKHIWPITWNGQPEDFSDATDITLTAKVYGQVKTLTEGVDYHIDGGNVVVDFTPDICDITGTYTVELNYIKPNVEFIDGDRRSAVDVQAFQIVNTSAEANATEGVSLPSEAMAAYALKYDDLTEEQKDELRGKGITSIDLTGEVGDTKTYTITYADGLTFDFPVRDGHSPIFSFDGTTLLIDGVPQVDLKGETGNGVASVELTSTVGLVKTYTITFTDDTTTTFTVTDGVAAVVQEKGGNTGIVMSQKAVTDELDQLAGEVSLLDAVQGAKIKDIESIISTMNPNQSAQVSVSGASPLSLPKNAANGGMSVKLEGLTEDVGGVITHFEPTGRVRSVDKNGLNPTHLYLTAPELRSNGTVKDEIRKGSNGYELVKRVGVGTLGDELITNAAYREFTSNTGWRLEGTSEISGGTLKINTEASESDAATKIFSTVLDLSNTRYFLVSFDLISLNHPTNLRFRAGSSSKRYVIPSSRVGSRIYLLFRGWGEFSSGWTTAGSVIAEIDNFSVKEVVFQANEQPSVSTTAAIDNFQVIGDATINCTQETPTIIPISHGGILNSAENGTVYHEPIIADAGVYDTKMDILLTDYPISAIEEIIKYEDGIDTYLNVATAVIASDGLSFTHPNLTDGDLVLFTYAYDKESTNGIITATFYDSNVVKIDTVTGKAYRITDVITNGVLTRSITVV